MNIYLKELNTNRIEKFESEDSIGVNFENWTRLTQIEIEAYELEKKKQEMLEELPKNREQKAENSTILYNDNLYSNSQNARIAINNFIVKLKADETAEYFPATYDKVVLLKKVDFKEIGYLIQSVETSLRKQEIDIIKEINACENLEDLNNININF